MDNSKIDELDDNKKQRTKTKQHLWYLNKITKNIPTNIKQSKKTKIKLIDKYKQEIDFLNQEITNKTNLIQQLQNELEKCDELSNTNYVCICGQILNIDSIHSHIKTKKHTTFISNNPQILQTNQNIIMTNL